MIVVFGPLPPPVTGAAKNTLKFGKLLAKHEPIILINSASRQNTRFPAAWKLVSAVKATVIALRHPQARLYLCVDAGPGIWISALVYLLFNILRRQCILHHRSFAYISKRHYAANLLTRPKSSRNRHIFLCNSMAAEFVCKYGKVAFTVVSNAGFNDIPPQPLRSRNLPSQLRLGHLSNLSIEKGLSLVLETAERCHLLGVSIKLALAGPVTGSRERLALTEFMLRYPSIVEVHGPLYEDAKAEFFCSIDLFLFPSMYRNEAEPNVVLEALSSAVPVLASNIGCLPCMIGEAGKVFDPTLFAEQASSWINEVRQSQQKFIELRANSLRQASLLLRQSQAAVNEVLMHMGVA